MSFAEYTSVLAAKFLARLGDDQVTEEALLERLDDIWAELLPADRARVKLMSAKIAQGVISRKTFAVDFAKFEAQQQLIDEYRNASVEFSDVYSYEHGIYQESHSLMFPYYSELRVRSQEAESFALRYAYELLPDCEIAANDDEYFADDKMAA